MRPIDPELVRAGRSPALTTAVLAAVAAGLVLVPQAALMAALVARTVQGEASGSLALVAGGLIAAFAARAALAWIGEVAGQAAASTAKARLRHEVLKSTIGSAGSAHTRQRRADTATLVIDGLDALDSYFARFVPTLVAAAVVPLVVILQLFWLDTTSAVVVTVVLPLIPLFMVLVGRLTEVLNRNRLVRLQRLAHHFLDVVEGMATLRIFGRGTAQASRVRESSEEYRQATMSTLKVSFLSSLVLETLSTLSVALVAVEVGLRLVHGGMALQTGLTIILLAPEVFLPLRQVGAQFHSSAAGLAAGQAARTLLDEPAPPKAATDLGDVHRLRVEVRGASVAHDDRTALAPSELSFEVSSGEVVCLAGPSGSGKSTALALVLGLRRPDQGDVTVAFGARLHELDDIDLASWHQHIAWVDQVPYIMDGTVADNVRLASPAADDAAMQRALMRAGLDFDLRRTVTARSISAGERRRLGVARAILRAPALLVLDEPTAGLDAETEAALLRTIREEADRGAAVLMATHHPAALATADRVVQL